MNLQQKNIFLSLESSLTKYTYSNEYECTVCNEVTTSFRHLQNQLFIETDVAMSMLIKVNLYWTNFLEIGFPVIHYMVLLVIVSIIR
ncbi:Uncharacterized protein FWK35_00033860 [Aphis craccivora]|uniref:Uncharacterized protein n=1 Tax=Aphis craccivora TaxID=307492 RepID=A0A6G0VYQ5_APHCR|nr:Uncharacterized protein FWK35_00033860 [Aphis craccivora]